MKRFGLLVLAALTLTNCKNNPTETVYDGTGAAGQFSTQSSPTGRSMLLATTKEGELVEVDLAAGQTRLIGVAGQFQGRKLRWSGLSFDLEGNLYASSIWAVGLTTDGCNGGATQDPGGRCSHLFRVDPTTGTVLQEVGNTGVPFLSDMDFAPDGTLFGTYYVNERPSGDGALASLDLSSGTATLIGRFGSGDGARDLENGGLSVHPVTGQVWAIENNFPVFLGHTPTIFQVDPATGGAIGPVVPIGLDGQAVTFGFGALEILPDGSLLAVSGGKNGGDMYVVDPAPDPVSGLAELTLIELAPDPAIKGGLNGLESVGFSNQPPVADAGAYHTLECSDPTGNRVTLDGSGSSDPDGDPITFFWSAPGVSFDDPTSVTPTGTFPLGTSTVTLTVTDPGGLSDQSTVEINVEDTTAPSVRLYVAIVNGYRGKFGRREAAFRIREPDVYDACDAAASAGTAALTLNGHSVSPGDLVRLRLRRRVRLKNSNKFDLRLGGPSFVLASDPVTDASGNSAAGQAAVTIELFADAQLSEKGVVPGTGEPGHSVPSHDHAAWELAKHLEKLRRAYQNPPGMPSAAVNPWTFD